MRLKLDENLGRREAEILRQAGHEVTTVDEQKFFGVADKDLIEVCRREGRCLVTLDLEFGNPLVFNPSSYQGIAVLRLPARSAPQDLSIVVKTLIGGLVRGNIEGRLWIIQRGRIREYQQEVGADNS